MKNLAVSWYHLCEQLQNTRPLIHMSLNKNSVYCVMPRSSKPPDICKWGGPKWPGILQLDFHSWICHSPLFMLSKTADSLRFRYWFSLALINTVYHAISCNERCYLNIFQTLCAFVSLFLIIEFESDSIYVRLEAFCQLSSQIYHENANHSLQILVTSRVNTVMNLIVASLSVRGIGNYDEWKTSV